MNGQLELALASPDGEVADKAPLALPNFELNEARTPAEILAWWDELVAQFTTVAATVQQRIAVINTELATLKKRRHPRRGFAGPNCAPPASDCSLKQRRRNTKPTRVSKARSRNSRRV